MHIVHVSPARYGVLALLLAACGSSVDDEGSGGSGTGGSGSGGALASCDDPGTVTLATPETAQSDLRDFNVELLDCTRTATELACALGVEHAVEVVIDGDVRRITANGIPNHDVGDFPNDGNPNTISAQTYAYQVPITPSGPGADVKILGITMSGVVLDPGTAETWNDDATWRYEALRYGTAPQYFGDQGGTDETFHPTALGLDCNFAHVQPTGAYHYHGIPTGLVSETPAESFVGWAADGYPIYGRWDHSDPNDGESELVELRSSYALRSGTRPSGADGPGGEYDGTFGADWEYVEGSGDLDECNGRVGVVELDGELVTTYHYVLTHTFPYIPRCTHATPDPSFEEAMGGPPPGGGGGPPMP